MAVNSKGTLAARVLVFVVACALVLAFVGPVAGKVPEAWRALFTGVSAGTAALLLTALFAKWDGVDLQSLGAAVDARSPLRFVFGFLTGLVLVAIWSMLSAVGGHLRWTRSPGVSGGALAIALLSYVALAAREELAFRGYPLRRLGQGFGSVVAQLVVALLFASEHRLAGASWADALGGVALGSLLFGAAALATRGLAVPIGLHAAWNFGQWTLGLKGAAGIWRASIAPDGEAVAHTTAMIAYAVVTIAATLAFGWWHRRTTAPA